MEQYTKKYFWLLPFFVIGLCAFFGAKAASHIIEAMETGRVYRGHLRAHLQHMVVHAS